jgi:CAAX protease family protein
MGVLLGGVVMSRLVLGVVGLWDLARRTLDPRRIARPWWFVVLLFFPVMTLLAGVIAAGIGAKEPSLDLAGAVARVANPVGLVGLMAFTLVIGPLPEEIGWRGYLLGQVQAGWKALWASVIVGLFNWVWHFPLFLMPGYSSAFNALPPTPLDLAFVVIPVGVLYAWVYNNTGGSVLAVMLFHFSGNFSGEFFGISEEALTIRLVLTVIVVVLVARGWGPTLCIGRQAGASRGLSVQRWRLLRYFHQEIQMLRRVPEAAGPDSSVDYFGG